MIRTRNTTKYVESAPVEKPSTWYLHMSVDPTINHLSYITQDKNDSRGACDYLKTWGVEMDCIEILGTKAEVMEERSRLEDERRLVRFPQ